MMYAAYIIDGKWDEDNVPAMLKPMIDEVVADLTKKLDGNEENKQ